MIDALVVSGDGDSSSTNIGIYMIRIFIRRKNLGNHGTDK
jgi:hypothetical protein